MGGGVGGGGIKESIGSWEGRAAGQGLFSTSLMLNAAANTEKLQFITIPPLEQACTETYTRKTLGKRKIKHAKRSNYVFLIVRTQTRRAKSKKCAKMFNFQSFRLFVWSAL